MNTCVSTGHCRSSLHPLAACLAVALVLPLRVALAATLPVTSCLDDGGTGTLRAVMNAAVSGDTIDLTQLTCSTITLTQGRIDTSWFGDHPVQDLTIDGPGRDKLTISGGSVSQVFIAGGRYFQGTFTLNDLTIAHGAVSYRSESACIISVGSALVLNRVTITDCHSNVINLFVFGGAVDSAASLEMTDSVISDSSIAVPDGIYAAGGGAWARKATLINSTISGNQVTAPRYAGYGFRITGGGGLYVEGDLTLINSTVSGNSIEATNTGENGRGGGVFARGNVTVIGSTIEGNSADGDGGGLFKPFLLEYYSDPGTTLVIENSTISGNSSGGAGGGFASQRPTTLANSTVAFNSSALGGGVMFRLADIPYDLRVGKLALQSSIIAGNIIGTGAPYAPDLATDGILTVTGANNLVMAADAAIVLPGDTLNADPLLLALADNGGLTRTHALGAGSPALDAGNNAFGFDFDQRGEGFPRVAGVAADIGAFEAQPVVDNIFRDGFDP